MKNLILLLSFVALFFIACTKPKDNLQLASPTSPSAFRYCPHDLLTWGLFKTGSYWVYKEANSGRTDSVFVYSSFHDTALQTTPYTQRGDEFYMYMGDAYSRDSSVVHIPPSFSQDTSYSFNWSTTIARTNDISDYSTTLMSSISQFIGLYMITRGDQVVVSYKYFNLSVNSFSFDSAIYVNHSNMIARYNAAAPVGRPCKEYYANHYGLVRYELPDSNQVWNLLRCHLIQ